MRFVKNFIRSSWIDLFSWKCFAFVMRLEEKKMNLKESSIYYESIFELKYYKDLSPA